MSFETWDEIESDTRFQQMNPQQQRKAKTLYAKFLGKTQGKATRDQFIQERIIGSPPPAARPELPFGLGPRPALKDVAAEIPGNAANFGREFVRGVVDNNPAAIVRRGTEAVSDAVYDNAIAKPLGLRKAAETRKSLGMPEGHRMMPRNPESEQSASGMAGAIASGFVDPINLVAPLNAFGKAAPVVSKGINLLPKAAKPAANLTEAVKAAAGAGATNFAIGGATSMAGQALDTGRVDNTVLLETPMGPVELPKTLVDASVSGGLGAGLGGLTPLARRALEIQALRQAEAAAQARAANGPVGRVSPAAPGTVSTEMLNANRMAMSASDDYFRPSVDITHPEVAPPARPAAQAVVDAAPVGERLALPMETPTANPKVQAVINGLDDDLRKAMETGLKPPNWLEPIPAAPPPRNLKALVSEEEGSVTMPNPEAVRAVVGQGVDLGLSGASAASRPARAIDKAVERLIEKPADLLIGAPARLFKQGKDALKAKAAKGELGVEIGNRRYSTADFVSNDAPAGYNDLVYDVENQTRKDLKGLEAEADRLEKEVGANQGELYDTVTDRSVTSPEAERVRELTKPISQELRDVGSLTEAQYKAFEGEYLPRSYVNKNDPLGGMVRKAVSTLKGFKHRGKREGMSRAQFALYSRDWEVASETPDGRVILRDAANGETRTVGKKKAGDFLGEWKSLGEFKNGNVKAWRDWTRGEREAMGEVKNVSVALRKMAHQARRDLRNGRILKAVAANPDWAIRIEDGVAKPDGWVAFDAARVKGDGAYKWGALRNHYVHPAIARDLQNAVELQNGLDTLQTLTGMRFWKKSKTVWNAVSHMNQLGSNMMTLELAGGSVYDIPDAIKVLKGKGEVFQEMEALGLFGDSFRATELAGNMPDGAIDWKNPLKATLGMAKAVDQFAGDIYQASDDMARAAYVVGKMKDGVPLEQAVKEARAKFYNGNNINSTFSRVASASALPFVKPVLYGLDKIPDLIAENPAKAAKLLLYWTALDQVVRKLTDESDSEREGKEALLPDYQKGPGKVMWTPFKDEYGQQQFVDVQNMNPVSQLVDTTERSALPEVEVPGLTEATGFKIGMPSALMPGGPLGIAYDIAANRDSFYGKDIKSFATNDLPGYVARSYLPSSLTNALPKLGAAMDGRPDHTGRRYGKAAAALNVFPGLKVQPFDAEMAYDKLEGKFEAQLKELEREMSRLENDVEDGKITESQYEKEMTRLEALYDKTEEEEEKRLSRADKAFQKNKAGAR